MSSEKSKKQISVRHGRLPDKEKYRDIMMLYFAGYPPNYIAARLGLPPQTINRNLKKIRTTLVWQHRLHAYLVDEALKVRFWKIDLYVWLAQNMMFIHANGEIGAIRHCLTKCPLSLKPKRFVAKHVDTTYCPHSFPFPVIPESRLDESYDGLFGQIDTRAICKACPMGAQRTYLPTAFSAYPELYIDLMYYLAHNRIPSDEEFFFHISMAAYIGAVRRIASLRLVKARSRGLNDEIGDEMITRKLKHMVNRIYGFMAMPISGPETMQQRFRYSGVTKGFPPG